MTKFKDWNYKEMGFNSESEMKESIARVERRMKMDSLELEIERRKEAQSGIDDRGGIDFTALNEGARLQELDRAVHQRILHNKAEAKAQAEREEWQSLFKAAGDSIAAEKEAEAQREMQKEKEIAEAELQQEIYSKHGVKTDEQLAEDEAYSNMLESLIK